MSVPHVSILYANGNLLAEVAVLDGIAGFVGTGSTPALLGQPKTIFSLAEAEELGITEDDEPTAHRHLKEFYAEVGGTMEAHIMLVPDTMTMADMLDITNLNGAIKLRDYAQGRVRLLSVFRTPDSGYDAGTGMFDDDVEDAVLASKTFAEACVTALIPLRIVIEGRVANFDTPATGTILVTTAGTNGNTITARVDEGGVSPVTIGAYTVQTSDTTAMVAAGLRAAIIALTGTTDYTATVSGSTVTVRPVGKGAEANDYTLSIVVTGTTAGTVTSFAGGSDYVTNTLVASSLSNGYAAVLVGGTLNDGSASVGAFLGRLCKYGAHIKPGKVANGPLTIADCYIGDEYIGKKDGERSISDARISALHGQGFVSFMKHPGKAGYYFGIDHMCSTDDYRRMAYGRVIDKAAIIAAAVYIEELEGEVEIDAEGKIDSLALAALETTIKQQINLGMAGQFSQLIVSINPNQNITATETLTVKLRLQPLGYKTFIDVDLGLAAPSVN